MYLLLLIYLLFFSSYRQAVHGDLSYNFIPFKEIIDEWNTIDSFHLSLLTDNLIGNILAFMPMGFFIPLLLNKQLSFINMLMLSFLISCIIEFLQLIFSIGVCDINDTILNSIGGGTGYCFYVFYSFLFRKNTSKYKTKSRIF
ncbi:VanZ family protein [Niallia sp. 03133]|uniref:VanZ family protein n=1 Tax=Niallia sp. 03133 TaxID=3458060 RepID=UPI004043A3BC